MARTKKTIDRALTACGWTVQDRASMNIHAGPGVAVREFPVVNPDGKRGSVDYLLYALRPPISPRHSTLPRATKSADGRIDPLHPRSLP